MTEATTPAAVPPSMPSGIPMNVMGQFLKDLSFENPGAPAALQNLAQQQPQVNVNVSISTRTLQAATHSLPSLFECLVTVKADGKLDNKPAFIVDCTYGGVFAFPPNLPEQVLRAMLMIEAPRLLFPFMRVIVADAVRDGGYGPLLINPPDFAMLYERQLQAERQSNLQAAGNA